MQGVPAGWSRKVQLTKENADEVNKFAYKCRNTGLKFKREMTLEPELYLKMK